MRITNNMITAQHLSGLQSTSAALQRAQLIATTGKRVNVASDDPTAASGIMKSNSSLRALEDYRRGVQRATSRLNQEDGVLQQVNDLLGRVKEIAVSQLGDTASAKTRAAAQAEAEQIFKQLVSLGNTRFGNEYLFGGDQSQTQPFSATGTGTALAYTTTNPSGQRQIQVDDGSVVTPTHDGSQVFLNTGLLDAVRDVARALDPTLVALPNQLSTAMTQLDGAFNAVQSVIGETGALANRLDSVDQNLASLTTNLTTFKSNLEEADIETAITDLTTRQLAYQAALMATSKVSGMSLVDYLR